MSTRKPRRKIALALLASVLLLPGCLPRQHQLPDETVPHKLATPARLTVYVRRDDGSYVTETLDVPAGWYVASPRIVDGP